MKKIAVILIKTSPYLIFLFFYIHLFSSDITASSNWKKYPQNPIFTPLANNWDKSLVLDPKLIKDNDMYKMWYVGNGGEGWRIGYASSINGINNWTRNVQPVLQPSGSWEKNTASPIVLKENDQYKIWYSTYSYNWISGQDRFRMGYSTSSSGLNWNKYPDWVIRGTINSWDSGGTDRGISVVLRDGVYHLWYAGTNDSDLTINPYWRIGYATSVDGINWTKQNNGNPVIVPSKPWELKNVSYPNVIFENGKYKMWYAASPWDMATQIVYAESLDGINWEKPENQNTVLTTGASGFDKSGISSPSVLHDGNLYKMWYSGFDGSKWSIGYATRSADLNVPLIKQTSNPWQSETYDFANLWSGAEPSTINRWGCAITSAVMVLKYYGFNKIDENTNLTPGTLNKWLIEQIDGYIPNGQTNWLAISRLSKLAASINNISNFKALEFSRKKTSDPAIVKTNLENSIPLILEEPGHFIVAKGINEDTFNINDPFHDIEILNDEKYKNTFLSYRRYMPSNTDLSYIMIVSDENIQISAKDSSDNTVGEQFTEEPITDPVSGKKSSENPIKIFYLPKPNQENYQIIVSSNNYRTYNINTYLYDINGNVKIINKQGTTGSSTSEIIKIDFDKENANNTKIEKVVAFQTLLDDIKEAQYFKLINNAVAKNLNAIALNAKKDYEKGNKIMAIKRLNTAKTLLNSVRGKGIDEKAYRILLYDINYLKTHL